MCACPIQLSPSARRSGWWVDCWAQQRCVHRVRGAQTVTSSTQRLPRPVSKRLVAERLRQTWLSTVRNGLGREQVTSGEIQRTIPLGWYAFVLRASEPCEIDVAVRFPAALRRSRAVDRHILFAQTIQCQGISRQCTKPYKG